MKLKTLLLGRVLLGAVASLAAWPIEARGQDIAQAVSQQIAALANSCGGELSPSAYNPCPAEDTTCGGCYCGSCSHCCRSMDTWGSAEFLMWWGKGSSTPALVTTSPQGTPQAQAGVRPDAEVLFGAEYLGNEMQVGGRATFGVWLDEDHNVGAGGRFYATGGDRESFRASSDGDPILARPFFNVLLDQNDALLIAFDNGGVDFFDGSIEASYTNQNFLGAEAFFEVMMQRDRCRRINLIAGYQFMRLDDWLQIDSTSFLRQFNDARFDIRDQFSTNNQFHGGQIGLRSQMMRGCWSVDALAKVALGVTRQEVTIDGRTIVNGGASTTGGLLAQETNIGEYQRDKFGYIPEFTCNLKYHATPTLSFHVGYSIIWWSDVVTAGRQIDTGVNPSQLAGGVLVGEARPSFEFEDEYYWMQGINFGMNWDF